MLKNKTKGAVSKIVQKLVTKGLVDKQPAKESNTEINLFLTDKGRTAYAHHKSFHENTSNEVLQFLDHISDQSFEDLLEVMDAFNKFLDHRIKNKDS